MNTFTDATVEIRQWSAIQWPRAGWFSPEVIGVLAPHFRLYFPPASDVDLEPGALDRQPTQL